MYQYRNVYVLYDLFIQNEGILHKVEITSAKTPVRTRLNLLTIFIEYTETLLNISNF